MEPLFGSLFHAGFLSDVSPFGAQLCYYEPARQFLRKCPSELRRRFDESLDLPIFYQQVSVRPSLCPFVFVTFFHSVSCVLVTHLFILHSRLLVTCICPLRYYSNFCDRELLDTFFIVIHKKKLMFLHWYHHITVLLYCWHCFCHSPSYGIVFVAMNFGVHALMYGYYFLMAVKMKPSWFNPIAITFLQSMFDCHYFVFALIFCVF